MTATQIVFIDKTISHNTDNRLAGIKLNEKEVLCAECGAIISMEDVIIVKEYTNWVDFQESIAEPSDLCAEF